MPWSIAGKISAPHGFWMKGGSAERAVYYAVCPSVPAAVSSAVRRALSLARTACCSYDEGRRCWADLWQKASIAGYQSFLCALSANLSATSLIAPLALPTAF
jgi:hypothetical protein